MNIVECLLNGSIRMDQFLERAGRDTELQALIRGLIPSEAIDHPEHGFWNVFPIDSLRCNDWDFYKFLFWSLHPNRRIANNLSIYTRIKKAYQYHKPEVVCTDMYEKEFDLYLDVIKDCFDGPEVITVVEDILGQAREIKSKAERIQYAKTAISEQFHVDKKKPRWLQEPEWPMGNLSPMEFVSQKRVGNVVQYLFLDYDNGETRIVEQFH